MKPDYNRAATLAALTLIKLGVTTTPVHPEALIRRCKNTRLMSYADYCRLPNIASQFPDAIDKPHPEALTQVYERGNETWWLVYYDSKMIHGDRWQFSMAHELGHIVMRHHGHDPAEEDEADFFAAHLLLPRAIVAELISQEIPLLEVNLYNLSNASRACLWMMQESEPSIINPRYNSILRQRFHAHISNEAASGNLWPYAQRPMALYSLTSYMTGYQEG